MATNIKFKKFITLPKVIRAFESVADIFKAIKARPSYSRALNGKSRKAGDIDVSSTSIKPGLGALKRNGKKA